MDFNFNNFGLKYQPERGITLGVVLSYIFCFNFKLDKFDRGFAYILHVSRIKDYKELRQQYKNLNDADLLKEVFFLSRNDKYFKLDYLREVTGLSSKKTFRDRFREYIKTNDLQGRRAFTLEETYKILEFWNPGFKGESMQALLKSELAAQYTNGNYEVLSELLIDNGVISKEAYASVDKLSPKIYNNLNELLNEKQEKDETAIPFCIYVLFLLSRIKKK